MLKGLGWFLLFAAIFFMGMHAAKSFQEHRPEMAMEGVQTLPQEAPAQAPPNQQGNVDVEPVFQPQAAMPEEEGEHLTKKTASFMEGIVTAFYELIVGLLYKLASIFF